MEHSVHGSGTARAAGSGLPRPGRKFLIVLGIFLSVLALSFLPVFEPLNFSLLRYLAVIWWAVLSGLLLGGVIFTLFDRLGWIEGSSPGSNPCIVPWHNIRNFNLTHAVKGVAAGGMSLAIMVLWWILIGVLLAALIGAYVPEHWFMQFLGPDLPGMLAPLIFATVLEVCSEGTSPIAFELYDNLRALGNPFIFLMAGVATDYTKIVLLWSNIGRRTAILLPIVTVPQIMLLGFLLNLWSG